MFKELYSEDTKLQLLSIWRFAGGYRVAGKLYIEALQIWAIYETVCHMHAIIIVSFRLLKNVFHTKWLLNHVLQYTFPPFHLY